MTNELEPLVSVSRIQVITGCCYLQGKELQEYIEEQVNTRYKRTCKPTVRERHIIVSDVILSLWQAVCDCGNIVGEDNTPNLIEFGEGCLDKFCSQCGAEVADGD